MQQQQPVNLYRVIKIGKAPYVDDPSEDNEVVLNRWHFYSDGTMSGPGVPRTSFPEFSMLARVQLVATLMGQEFGQEAFHTLTKREVDVLDKIKNSPNAAIAADLSSAAVTVLGEGSVCIAGEEAH